MALLILASLATSGSPRAAAASVPAATTPDDRQLRLGERTPIAVVVGSPTGENARVRSSEVIRLVSEQLRAHTDFTLQLVEPNVLADCKGRLLCLVEKVGGAGSRAEAPPYLLVFSNLAREGEADRLSAQLIDVERAHDTIERGRSSREAWVAEVEATLNDGATATERAAVGDVADAERVIAEWFEHRFARDFEASGHWDPYGEVVITTQREGLEISFDGQSVGATARGRTRIGELRAGTRTLVLVGPTIDRFEVAVNVQAGAVTEISPEVSSTGGAGPLRDAVWVSGAAMAVAGVVVSAVALASHDGDVLTSCFVGTAGCEAGSGFETSGFDGGAAATLDAANPGGVLMLPLGYSLVSAGAIWTVGALFFSEEDELPWLPVVIGAGVGVLAYTLSAVASTRPEVTP